MFKEGIFYRYQYNYIQSNQLCLAHGKKLIGIKGLLQILQDAKLHILNNFIFIAEAPSKNGTISCTMASLAQSQITLQEHFCFTNVIVCENASYFPTTTTILIICILAMLLLCLCGISLIINTGQQGRRRREQTFVLV